MKQRTPESRNAIYSSLPDETVVVSETGKAAATYRDPDEVEYRKRYMIAVAWALTFVAFFFVTVNYY